MLISKVSNPKHKRVIKLLKRIPTNDITNLNNLIYTEVKRVSNKLGISLKNEKRKQ